MVDKAESRGKYQQLITSAKRIVIKIGSALLVDKTGQIANRRIASFVELVDKLIKDGKEVVIVSSGAVASARSYSFFNKMINTSKISLQRKQALASIGQVYLMEKYRRMFEKKNHHIAQVLISKFSINHRQSYLNARNTINELLSLKVIPIINENDPLATEEFRFGENDILAALTSGLVEANLYIIFSDVEGFYQDYLTQPKVVPLITKITPSLLKEITPSKNSHGSGGMDAKLEAARVASNFKIPTLIANGHKKNLYDYIFSPTDQRRSLKKKAEKSNNVHNPYPGTLIINYSLQEKSINAKKRWLFSNVSPKASIEIDDGAVRAVKAGKSLLPSGVVNVHGKLQEGDICNLVDHQGSAIARGLCNFNKKDLHLIRGAKTDQIKNILGRIAHHEVIHCDNLALLKDDKILE